MVTQKILKEKFDYDSATGNLIRIQNSNHRKDCGQIAGTIHHQGYRTIKINYKLYLAHRLVWMYHYGVFPTMMLDHINGIRADNRIENLREVTPEQNNHNQICAHKNNQSGKLGVRATKFGYEAWIKVKGKHHYLGGFSNPEDAHAAYINAKRKLHSHGTL